MDISLLSKIQETHLAIWNERDRAKRDELMATIYAENIKMYDKDFVLAGIKEISDFIDKLHSQESNFVFTAEKPMDFTQNGARLYWEIHMGEKQDLLTGMDFFIVENEKVAHLYVFMKTMG